MGDEVLISVSQPNPELLKLVFTISFPEPETCLQLFLLLVGVRVLLHTNENSQTSLPPVTTSWKQSCTGFTSMFCLSLLSCSMMQTT